jgi:hypothetical protein
MNSTYFTLVHYNTNIGRGKKEMDLIFISLDTVQLHDNCNIPVFPTFLGIVRREGIGFEFIF